MAENLKRSADSGDGVGKRAKLEDCPHGTRCYRRNPHHFKEYEHAHLMKLLETGGEAPTDWPQNSDVYKQQLEILKPLVKKEPQKEPSTSKIEAGTMLGRLERAQPYNYFFTTIPESKTTLSQDYSITFTDLLCPSLGALKSSLQINFMIDIGWLIEQYKARNVANKPLTILYGDDWPDMTTFIDKFLPNVTYKFIKMKDPFGCHHSKIGIYSYEDDSIRVVVSTANLYSEDWNLYNQGLWISPLCRRLPETGSKDDGESPTGFKNSLIQYLNHYREPILKPWLEYVEKADFSAVRVFLVTSVPGKHYPKDGGCHLHRMADLLSRHCTLPVKTTPDSEGPLSWGIMAQSSSIGSLGKSPAEWLRSCLLRSLAAHKNTQLVSNSNATLNLIFPSVENVLKGYWGPDSGGCLPYSKATNEKQPWINNYLHQWKADKQGRTRSMPHIKSYCRISPNLTKLAYFLLTSANISKSAWGGNIQKDSGIYIRSYEAGVLFLPKFFDEDYFEIEHTSENKNKKLFPFMYDLPLEPYKSGDTPWCN